MPPFHPQSPSTSHSGANMGAATKPPAPTPALIPDRAEFIDALTRLRRGELLVHSADTSDERCLIEGQVLYTSWKPLSDFGLLDELPRQPRQGRIHCYRLSPRGRDFADRACTAWKKKPLWQRLAVRLAG
jgi:hypothetical protein